MANTSHKMAEMIGLIKRGKYFVINRPRQYGKTTTLKTIEKALNGNGEWLVLNTSFEGLGVNVFTDEQLFCRSFLDRLIEQLNRHNLIELVSFLKEEKKKNNNFSDLSDTITSLAHRVPQKMVLLIDEVDRSSDHNLFLELLGTLRHKYLYRDEADQKTFHSIILAGVRDIKTLKAKIRVGHPSNYNSPWNIAANFDVDMNFHPHEIKPMLDDYAKERGVKLDSHLLSEKLFYYTSGYPFLVSALCKIFDEKILAKKTEKTWTEEDTTLAAKMLIYDPYSNTNFDSLVKNLENNPDLYNLAYNILVEGEYYDFNIQDPLINLGVTHGIFKKEKGVKIHNRIYQELILNYMTSRTRTQIKLGSYGYNHKYLLPGDQLNVEMVLENFQQFMQEQKDEKDKVFLERNGRLVFLGFLQPIINGQGFFFKEPQISDEKRMDVVITFFQNKYIIEMKVWRGKSYHENGLEQLADYLGRQNLDTGYLLIFDQRSKKKSWDKKWLTVKGKKIFAAWV